MLSESSYLDTFIEIMLLLNEIIYVCTEEVFRLLQESGLLLNFIMLLKQTVLSVLLVQ